MAEDDENKVADVGCEKEEVGRLVFNRIGEVPSLEAAGVEVALGA